MAEEGTKRPRGRPPLEESRGPHTVNMSEELWELLEEISAAEKCRPVHLIEELVKLHYGDRPVPQRGYDPGQVGPLLAVGRNRLADDRERAIARRILKDYYGIIDIGAEGNQWVSATDVRVEALQRRAVEEALDAAE